jgi:hypothetical protein
VSRPPLLIYHTSFLPYLPFALWQNSKTHPNRQVIFLGDRTNRCHGINYVHQDVAEYQQENKKFIQIYRHAVDAHFGDERRCIERWFVLSEFLSKTGLESFYFLDSDYFLLESLDRQEQGGLPREPWGTPHLFGLAFFPDADLVRRLCAWILDLYRNESRFLSVKSQLASEGWGLQEMGLILAFCREEGIHVESRAWQQNPGDACFDNGHFGSSYQHNRGVFESLRQEEPGGPVTGWDGQQRRRLLGLHFGGNQKCQIPGFTGWCPAVIRAFFRPNYRRNLKHLCQYLWHGIRCRSQLARSEPIPAKE